MNFAKYLIAPLVFSAALGSAEEVQPEPEDIFEVAPDQELFRNLELVKKINTELSDELPFLYNYNMIGGYFNMPSARMAKTGMIALGAARVKPYDIYGLVFQVYDRVELSLNYRVYKGLTDRAFGHEGFGDEAERIGNAKIGLLIPRDDYPMLPQISVGAEDFIGTKRFSSQYIVATKQFLDWNLECTFGWGHGRLKGPFGGAAWSPFRHFKVPVLKDLTFLAEYDAINYKKHLHEHPS
ncbi:MAG TPA: YjbH domain-containing protein, partial [Candidatus Paceibacterota bacterium]